MEDDILSVSNYIKVQIGHYGRLLAKQVDWLNFLILVVFVCLLFLFYNIATNQW